MWIQYEGWLETNVEPEDVENGEYALRQRSPTLFLEIYHPEDFSSNHNCAHLTI